MARTIQTFTNGTRKTVVRYDGDLGEYVVIFSQEGKRRAVADYFTDDREDAIQTARVMVGLPATE